METDRASQSDVASRRELVSKTHSGLRSPVVLLLLGLVAASTAHAEITVDSSGFAIDVFAGRDQNGDDIILDEEADLEEIRREDVLSFSETLSASTSSSSASADQTTNVSTSATTLSLVSSGSCEGAADQGDEATQGDGSGDFTLRLNLTAPARLSATGSLSASGGGRASVGDSLGLLTQEVSDGTQPIAVNTLLEPGGYFVSGFCAADTQFNPGFGGRAAGSSSWQLQLTLTEGDEECQPETLAWVGKRAGAFADPANWAPARVPLSDENAGRCDGVVIRGVNNLVLDLDAGAPALGAAAAPVPIHRVEHFVVDASRSLRPVDGTIEGIALSPVAGERSVEVINEASLLLDGGGVFARHLGVGSSGTGAIEVAGTGGYLETTGRLGLGIEGAGDLIVRDGGTAIAAEAVLGERDAQGSATVRGAASTLDTGSLAVGLEDDGALLIEAGGRVTSETGVIGFDLDGDERGDVEVRGKDAPGNPSTWTLDSLDVRPRGHLYVAPGGKVEIAGPLKIGAEGAPADCLQRRACVTLFDGQLSANGVTVGDGGGGVLEISGDSQVSASGSFVIATTDTYSQVVLEGPSLFDSVFTDLAVATGANTFGTLEVRAGGRLDLLGRFRLGGLPGSLGSLLILGDAADSEATVVSSFEAGGLDSVIGGSEPSAVHTAQLQLQNAVLEIEGIGHDLVIEKTGLLNGSGGRISLEDSSKLVNRGFFVGDFVIEGDYVQEPGAFLNASLLVVPSPVPAAGSLSLAAAAPPAPPFHPVVVAGNATLAGTAKLQFGNGAAPQQGDAFELLKVQGTVTGAFDEVAVAGLASGFAYGAELVNGALVVTALNDAAPLPYVNLAGKPTLLETKKGAKVKLMRSGDTTAPLTVAYTVGGSAESGVDYVALPGTIEFPARKKSVKLLVVPIADGLDEGSETIELSLAPDASFAPGLASTLVIELLDGKTKK